MSYAIIKNRRGTFKEWSLVDPVLQEGELVIEYPETGLGTGLCKFKVGDGIRKYTELQYAFDGTSASSIIGGGVDTFNLITIRQGSSEEWENSNPILQNGELAYDSTNKSLKIGDGTTRWNDLSFINSQGLLDDVMDYGDEDYDPNLVTNTLDNSSYPDSVQDLNTATLSDIIDNKQITEEK